MATVSESPSVEQMKKLSPRRNSSTATTLDELVHDQLLHFGIDADSDYGNTLERVVRRMYENQDDIEKLWAITMESMNSLSQTDKISRFNSKKFLSFQLAKL